MQGIESYLIRLLLRLSIYKLFKFCKKRVDYKRLFARLRLISLLEDANIFGGILLIALWLRINV